METYNGEKVLASLEARMEATDANIPDCRCELCLTEGHLYVLEDNYDGTYETHYKLSMRQIREVRVTDPSKTSIDSAGVNEGVAQTAGIIFTIIAYMGGMIGGAGKRKAVAKKKYLEVVYDNGTINNEHIYFCEFRTNPKIFVKNYEKISTSPN